MKNLTIKKVLMKNHFPQENQKNERKNSHKNALSHQNNQRIVLILNTGNVTTACSIKTLNQLKISHILSIDSFQLPDIIRNNSAITTKFVQSNFSCFSRQVVWKNPLMISFFVHFFTVSDMPKEDLLEVS
jgi:hypothetical protein